MLRSVLRPIAALLLLSACDTPTDNSLEAKLRSDYAASDVAALNERIEKLEANAKVDGANIDTLFKARDAMNKTHATDQKWNEEAFDRLFENDKRLNANSPNPAPYQAQ